VNTKSLTIGQGASGCFLTAQGKIRAYFTLWNFDQDSYAFEFDAGSTDKWKSELLAAIDQYTFSEKMTLTDFTGKLESIWIFLNTSPNHSEDTAGEEAILQKLAVAGLQPGETRATSEEIRICHHGNLDYGRTWLSAWGRPGRLTQWVERSLHPTLSGAQSCTFSDLEAWRVQALRPRVDAEITEAVLPLEVGLREAISENKGCYPGQEVIEKIISLGSPPRRLAQIVGQGKAPHPGSLIFNLADPAAEVGQITTMIQQNNPPGSFQALGFIRKIHAKEGLQVRFSHADENSPSQGAIVKIAPYA
jgi:folate-binding protein YgfZ